MKVCSLFSGIGGFELGLRSSGHWPILFCEINDSAAAILQRRFPDVKIERDIRTLEKLPDCDIVTAGWPCQDLSQAGKLAGISGPRSSLISDVFRLIRSARRRPRFILLENVAFSLYAENGSAIEYVTSALTELGYNWCYRVLDAQFFGKPQRRRRLYVLADLDGDPCRVLFRDTRLNSVCIPGELRHFGFYWTEGNTGLGWSPEALPPIKGGSGLSIPSPPAVWDSYDGTFCVPGITDAERLQGFPVGWTSVQELTNGSMSQRHRWTLLGNSVNVPVIRWIAKGLDCPGPSCLIIDDSSSKQPNAGFGGPNEEAVHFRSMSEAVETTFKSLTEFKLLQSRPLSSRAARGFYDRITRSSLKVPPKFIGDLGYYSRHGEQ